MKTYTTKANAIRAAKQAGWVPGDYEIIEVGDRFGYRLNEAEDASEGKALEVMEQERDETQNPDAPEEQTDAPADEPQREEAPTRVVKERNASTIEKPTRKVWEIADSMPGAKRKDIIAACVAQGIAFFTARTQYQKWMQASREVESMKDEYAALQPKGKEKPQT